MKNFGKRRPGNGKDGERQSAGTFPQESDPKSTSGGSSGTAPLAIHSCCCSSPGLTMDGALVTEINNAHGQRYFKAVAQIGSIFGSEVQGECSGIGRTREEALQRLKEDQAKLYESLWY